MIDTFIEFVNVLGMNSRCRAGLRRNLKALDDRDVTDLLSEVNVKV
jgi:hypothetical protein